MIKQYINFPKHTDIEIHNMNEALYRCVLDGVIEKKLSDIQKMLQDDAEALETEKRIAREALEIKNRIAREALEVEQRIQREALAVLEALPKKNVKYIPPRMRR